MSEIEFVLAVNVGQIDSVQHPSLLGHLLIKRRSRYRRVQHELMKVSVMRDGIFNFFRDVVAGVMFQANDRGTQHADAMFAKFPSQLSSVRRLAAWRSPTVETPVPSITTKLPSRPAPACCICEWRWRRRIRKAPSFSSFSFMSSSRRMARARWSRKFSSIMKKAWALSSDFHLAHHFKQFVPGLVEVDELALAAEERRCRAEIAAHGTSHGRNNGGGRSAGAVREASLP